MRERRFWCCGRLMSDASVDILLATRNGAAFLPVQLRSLLEQTDRDFRILARDDGSTDGTQSLLRSFATKHPGALEIVSDDTSAGSASANFSLLMAASSAPYVMFCDQDDQWLPGKVAATRERMAELEERHGRDTPLLVHTDLAVVDEGLAEIDASMWHFQKLDPASARRFNRMLVQNAVTGCTVMANRALLEKAHPVAPEAIMHDWWLVLVASAFGAVGEVSFATMRYRQHERSDRGAERMGIVDLERKLMNFSDREELRSNFQRTLAQADAFARRYADELDAPCRAQVEAYAALGERGWLGRRWAILRHGFLRMGWIRNLGMFARL
jgi:glycosyltransferase involved in cell wall biosynthesis